MNILMGAGWYREAVYPREVYETSTNDLADRLVREIIEGVDGTGVRAWVHRRDRHRTRGAQPGQRASVPCGRACSPAHGLSGGYAAHDPLGGSLLSTNSTSSPRKESRPST